MKKEVYKSRVYTDRPDYADFEAPQKFEAIKSIIAKRLTDKNGTKIFESDIVTSDEFCPDNEGYGVINWRDEELMFTVDTDDAYYDFVNLNWVKLEVIGNMFDNPELIRGVEE